METIAQVGPGLFLTGGIAAAGAAAISVPVIIHLLTKFRRTRQLWGAMRFLMEAYRKHRTRLQLEQIILLIIRCLILAFLGLALARPMLQGSLGGLLTPIADSGKVVHIVLDDSLTTRTELPDGSTRFDQLQKDALELIDALDTDDRVAVWLASRPGEALIAPPAIDHATARLRIEGLKPTYSPADITATLGKVNASIQEQRDFAGQASVVILSDFATGSVAIDRSLPADIAALSDSARIIARPPMESRPNVQILSFNPRRHLVLADAGVSSAAPSIPLDVTLRRLADESADRLSAVTLTIIDEAGKERESRIVEHRWAVGQSIASITVDLPIDEQTAEDLVGTGGQTVVIRAALESAAGAVDALRIDDVAYTVVELRKALRVAIIDGPAGDFNSEDESVYSPGEWLSFSLTPFGDGPDAPPNWPVLSGELSAANITADQLSGIDAALVLRPDRLSDGGIKALAAFARAGGLVWFFTPPTDQGSGAWGAKIVDNFDVDWRIGLEVIEFAADPSLETDLDALRDEDTSTRQAWRLVVDQGSVPEPLRLLAADWPFLLRPITVNKRIALEIMGTEGASQNVWLRLDEDDEPLLAGASVGDGYVMLLGTALDSSWSNLPTKPLFPPLVHESLRGVLGESATLQRLSSTKVGDQPLLNDQWTGAERLVLRQGPDDAPANSGVLLQRSAEGLASASMVKLPGVYGAVPEPAGRRVPVNIEAQRADTRSIEASRLELWLNGFENWQWMETRDVKASIASTASMTEIGWHLLWVVLALMILETILAKRFSHAATSQRGTVAELAGMVRKMSGAQ